MRMHDLWCQFSLSCQYFVSMFQLLSTQPIFCVCFVIAVLFLLSQSLSPPLDATIADAVTTNFQRNRTKAIWFHSISRHNQHLLNDSFVFNDWLISFYSKCGIWRGDFPESILFFTVSLLLASKTHSLCTFWIFFNCSSDTCMWVSVWGCKFFFLWIRFGWFSVHISLKHRNPLCAHLTVERFCTSGGIKMLNNLF